MIDRPARYEILLTHGAEQDLESTHHHLAGIGCEYLADRMLDRFMEVFTEVSYHPERGKYSKEFAALGIKNYRVTILDYRLTKFRPRLVYRVLDDKVIIYLIADGREDMQSLLARRMLGA
jgi:toxin ParE1/3/4